MIETTKKEFFFISHKIFRVLINVALPEIQVWSMNNISEIQSNYIFRD